jgi:hypothetical protein
MARGCRSPIEVIPFLARADDLHAFGYALLELAVGAAAAVGDGSDARDATQPVQDAQSLKRLVEDVFGGDAVGAFREYCAEEPLWSDAVALLDEGGGAGWRLVQACVECREPASEEAESVSARVLLGSDWFIAA